MKKQYTPEDTYGAGRRGENNMQKSISILFIGNSHASPAGSDFAAK